MKHLLTTVVAIYLAATVSAQQGAQPKPQPAPAPAKPPSPFVVAATDPAPIDPFGGPEALVNVRYEIRIREEGGPQPVTKMVSMTGTLHETSLVRAGQDGPSNNPLNVDVTPANIRDMKVLTKLGIQYTPQRPAVAPGAVQAPMFGVRQNVSVWLESGKPMVISQSADPLSDRRLIVEVTATIIR